MGAFMIYRIRFKDKKAEKKFLKTYKPRVLVNDNSDSFGFGAWQTNWQPGTLICDMGFCGYAEARELLKEFKGKIAFLAELAINDANSTWEKYIGRW